MTQQDPKPTANTPISERRHLDPPGLWATVILSSFVIHLFVFGMLRLWITLRINSVLAATNLISIDVIAEPSVATFPTQPTQTITSAANTSPKTPNQLPNNSTSSTSAPANSSQTSTQQNSKPGGKSGTANQSPSVPGVPTVRKSPAPNPTPNQSGEIPTQTPSPAPNSAQNQSSETRTPLPKPNSSTNEGNQPNNSTTSPFPDSNPSTEPPQAPNSSESGAVGILISTIGEPNPIPNKNEILHPNDPNYKDQLATLLEGSTQLSSDEFKQLGITLERDLVLNVVVVIDETGKATAWSIPPQELPGNLSSDRAFALAQKSIAKLKFNPTLMAGQPVARDYILTIKISPSQK